MKYPTFKTKALAGFAVALLGGAGLAAAQTADITLNTFDSAASGTGTEWGPGVVSWDGSTGDSAGAALFAADFGSGSDTALVSYICASGGNPWYAPQTINFSQYKSVEFDIKWDTTSDMSIAQFNDISTWTSDMTNSSGQTVLQSWAGGGSYLAGSTPGLDVDLCGPVNQLAPTLITTNIPDAAANGWVHISVPINPAMSGIDGQNGIVFHKWIHQNWGIANDAIGRFWIDNVVVKGTAGPPPPPTVSSSLTAPVAGLNVFASTEGNAFYDRQEAVLRQNTGLGWVGQASSANPVSYSFTITGFPNSENAEAYLFLAPNELNQVSAPDWNETNCALVFIQGDSSKAVAHFQYKVNEPSQNQMYGGGGTYTNTPSSWDGTTANYLETGNLASVTNNTGILGTWTLQFTSATNGALIGPSGVSTSFIIPPYYVSNFVESANFNIYLGMQANAADGMNQAVVYSNFAVTGTATPFSENFLADSVLDTTNTWNTSYAGGPKAVLVVPTNSAAYWVKWSLPDSGFNLTTSSSLTTSRDGWSDVTGNTPISLYGQRAQLVNFSDLPSGTSAYFSLLQRTFSQLQILLPGETNAPNTATGKIGTPLTTLTTSDLVNVTINAVDSTYHIVSSSSDALSMSSTDSGAVFVNGTPSLTSGTVTAQVYLDAGTWTVTATDTTSSTINAVTSSSITIQ